VADVAACADFPARRNRRRTLIAVVVALVALAPAWLVTSGSPRRLMYEGVTVPYTVGGTATNQPE
jgi:hypothetical protein